MRSGKDNEMRFILSILKSPEKEYNANSLSNVMGISPMGALKIARKLEKESIIASKKIGRANIYKINFENDYSKQYVKFLLKKEVEDSPPYVKRWIRELQKIKNALGIVLYGSVLIKEKEARDIDVLIIVNKKKFESIKDEIEEINIINNKKIHPLYQTKEDLQKHIKEENKVILNAIKGIVVFGEDLIIGALRK